MIINTNVPSLFTQNYLRLNNRDMEEAMARLSSGKRVNTAKDDAAGLAIIERMNTQVRGMDVAVRNANDGISLLQTAESALGSITSILQRIRELAVQADNGTYNEQDRKSMQDEVVQLLDEITHIRDTASFNGIKLLQGDGTTTYPIPNLSVNLHISDLWNDTIAVTIGDASLTSLGLHGIDISEPGIGPDNSATGAGHTVVNPKGAQDAISLIDIALDRISANRAALGAMQNRLQFTIDNLNTSVQNTTAARSRIEDADMAKESSRMTRDKILSNSAMSMLIQANQTPQMVAQLLQNL